MRKRWRWRVAASAVRCGSPRSGRRLAAAGAATRGSPPPGNLYATLLLGDPAPAEYAPELSFVTALAVHDAIFELAPGLRDALALKWPNDILCGGAKLAGILIEGERVADKFAVAIGVGVNCLHHPEQTAYPATDLAAAGAPISAENLFAALSGRMVERLAQWAKGAGFAAVRADWMARAAGIGGEMRVRLSGREFFGRFEALDEQGRLLLRLADGGLQAITAGEVFPLAGAPPPIRWPTAGHVD